MAFAQAYLKEWNSERKAYIADLLPYMQYEFIVNELVADQLLQETQGQFIIFRDRSLGHYTAKHGFTVIGACPKCKAQMVLKNGKYGEFLGCSEYRRTKCTGKRKINVST